jgi:hypothetical protein
MALTTQAVRDRQKTVTRRLGWKFSKPGDRLTACPKVQGRRRKDGTVDPLVRICDVELVDTRRERLDSITLEDVEREGFPGWTPAQYVAFFCEHMKGPPDTEVTVLTWRYLDGETP